MLKRKLITFFIILGFTTIPFIPGCQQVSKKPPAQTRQLAPEVQKYKDEEPTISLYRKQTGQREELKLEEYIKGVVAAEIGSEYPIEALKAQAIVARTSTLALLEYEGGARKKHNTDASDDHTEFQAYNEKAITEKISKAVEDTRGKVLVHNGKFIYALFHAVSKDHTASIEEGFPELKEKAAYLVSVPTNGLTKAPDRYTNWVVKVPKSQVRQIMGAKAGTLENIKISEWGPSGRALTITAGQASIPAIDLRQKIGFDRLYSTAFSSITIEGDYVVFKGNGWGHGVGMEQWGAYVMAEEGKNAQQIVEHYYPQAQIVELYK